MTDTSSAPTGLSARFAALPTGLKMLVMLSLSLLPLGLIAIVASVQAADGARESRNSEARLIAEVSARQLTDALARTEISLKAATAAFPMVHSEGDQSCMATLDALAAIEDYEVRYAIVDDVHGASCATAGFSPPAIRNIPPEQQSMVMLGGEDGTVLLVVSGPMQHPVGIALLPAETVTALTEPAEPIERFSIALVQGEERQIVHPWGSLEDRSNVSNLTEPVAGGQLELAMAYNAAPLQPAEVLSIALPLLIWLAAALLGWIAVDLLLLRPLSRLRSAVDAHSGNGEFRMPEGRISAVEIRELGQAFDHAFAKLHDNEEKLAAGLTEQTRLTREVHHRVKNNLQIIASLLSLHARAAKSEDSAAAYASIQRRVDALAIVQRNLFAELDKAEGLPLRPVLAELASGLQQGAPVGYRTAITLDVASIRVAQDIAAPVAFLVTELVELAMLSGTGTEIAVSVEKQDVDRAQLCITSPALKDAGQRPEFSRYLRVLQGLARQLRSNLEESEGGTRFCIDIPYF